MLGCVKGDLWWDMRRDGVGNVCGFVCQSRQCVAHKMPSGVACGNGVWMQ